jgi:hypothetical protein
MSITVSPTTTPSAAPPSLSNIISFMACVPPARGAPAAIFYASFCAE